MVKSTTISKNIYNKSWIIKNIVQMTIHFFHFSKRNGGTYAQKLKF